MHQYHLHVSYVRSGTATVSTGVVVFRGVVGTFIFFVYLKGRRQVVCAEHRSSLCNKYTNYVERSPDASTFREVKILTGCPRRLDFA